jgi:rubrerythrin
MDDFTLHEALKLAVKTEQIGEKVYTRFAKKFADNKEVAEVFERLAKDERVHESQFQALLDRTPKNEGAAGRYEEDDYLRATAISEFFKGDVFESLAKVETPSDALANAVGLERATLLFYQAIRDKVGPNTALDELIEHEKDHLTTLMKVAMTDAKFRGLTDKW